MASLQRLRALMDGRLVTAPDRSNLVLLAAQLILEEALEGEVRDEIGRDRYERAEGEASGYRNGYSGDRPGRQPGAHCRDRPAGSKPDVRTGRGLRLL
jgi:hypothetical protein